MSQYKVHRVRFIESHPKPINSAAFDTVKDNPKIAISREDGSIELRDPACNWMIDYVIPGKEGRTVEHLVWNDGRLFSGGLNGQIIEWDLQNLEPKYFEDSNGGPVWCLRFNNAKNVLAAGCEDGSIRIFQVMTHGLNYQKSFHKQENRILSIAWNHNDTKLVAGGFDSTIRIYDVKSGQISTRISVADDNETKTMVWAIEILNDSMTIVTGDSCGHTQFWDGNTGTLIQDFKSHEADVLTLAVNGSNVYSSGVDSQIIQFAHADKEKGAKQWVVTKSIRISDYDVRALVASNNMLVAAGVSPNLSVFPLDNFHYTKVAKYPSLPLADTCQIAGEANQVLYCFQRKLNLWQLENTDICESNSCKLLLEVNSESDDHLLSSAISSCGKYLCYSTISKSKLYEIKQSPLQLKKYFIQLPSLSKIVFTPDSNYLIGTTFSKTFHLVDLENENDFEVEISNDNLIAPIRFLRVSNDSKNICIVDSKSNCFVFKVLTNGLRFLTQLPTINDKISAIAFNPTTNNIFLSTSSKNLFEFDIKKEKFEPWLFPLNRNNSFKSLGKDDHTINKITFNPKVTDEIFLQCSSQFGKILHGSTLESPLNKDSQPEKKKLKLSRSTGNSPLKINSNYYKILHFSFNNKGEIVVVERPSSDSTLPTPLKIKRWQTK